MGPDNDGGREVGSEVVQGGETTRERERRERRERRGA